MTSHQTDRQTATIERMRAPNEFILNRPIISILGTTFVMLFIAGSFNNVGAEPGTGPSWLTWAVLALLAYGVVTALMFPRMTKTQPHDLLVLLWVMAWAPYFVALIVGGMLGGATWLPSPCLLGAVVVMIVSRRMAVASSARATATSETDEP